MKARVENLIKGQTHTGRYVENMVKNKCIKTIVTNTLADDKLFSMEKLPTRTMSKNLPMVA